MEYTLGADRLWQRTGGPSPEQRWFHGDAQLSTRLLTTSAGAIGSQLTYEAFGSDVGLSGSAPTAYRYTGQQADSTTGGYYLRARYMSPTVGRFVSEDPFIGVTATPSSLQRYTYASLNPVDAQDPTGRMTVVEVGMGAMIIGFLAAMVLQRAKAGDAHRDAIHDQALRAAASLAGRDDCEALAQIVDFAASLYGDPVMFVTGLQAVLTERDGIFRSRSFVGFNRFGATGFKPEFQDRVGENGQVITRPGATNQVRHFMGFFAAGFFAGNVGGHAILTYNEREISRSGDWLLGEEAIAMGEGLRDFQYSRRDLAPLIRQRLHE